LATIFIISADENARSDSVRMLPSALRLKLSAVAEKLIWSLNDWGAPVPVLSNKQRWRQLIRDYRHSAARPRKSGTFGP
jgi:hypothetical protein